MVALINKQKYWFPGKNSVSFMIEETHQTLVLPNLCT